VFENLSLNRTTTSLPVCRFYVLGTCRFGSSCKFSHTTNTALETMSVSNINEGNVAFGSDTSIECGICISVPKVFGILSNCDCVFCLECIRDWRKEGLTVAKTSEQVRYACTVPNPLFTKF